LSELCLQEFKIVEEARIKNYYLSLDYLQEELRLSVGSEEFELCNTPVCPTFELDRSLNIKGQQVVEMESVCLARKPCFVNVLLCRLCNFIKNSPKVAREWQHISM
jgi:hypothetical protein